MHSRKPDNYQRNNKELLKTGIIKSDVPHGITSHLLTFSDKNILYARQFVSKMCCSSWHCVQYFVEWKPNGVLEYKTLMRDGRGRSVSKQGFVPTKNAKRD